MAASFLGPTTGHLPGEEEEEEGPECRVCRDVALPTQPLVCPCKCAGSIKFVHEECLVKWLQIKNSTACEVCGHVFKFSAVYEENTPDKLPMSDICGALVRLVVSYVPSLLRYCYVALLWLVILPLKITWGFMLLEQDKLTFSEVWARMTPSFFWEDMQYGIFVMVSATIFALAIVAFTDFYRWRAEDHAAIEQAMQEDLERDRQGEAAVGGGDHPGGPGDIDDDAPGDIWENMPRQQRERLEARFPDDFARERGLDLGEEGLGNEQQPFGPADGQGPAPAEWGGAANPVDGRAPAPVDRVDGMGRGNANRNNNFDDDLDEAGAVEIQLPFLALVGIEGHPVAAVRNVVVFWLFVSSILLMTVHFPKKIGRIMLRGIFGFDFNSIFEDRPITNSGLQFFVGHGFLLAMLIGTPFLLERRMYKYLNANVARGLLGFMFGVAAILKITVLFAFKMGIYPVCLGIVWHASDIQVFGDLLSGEFDMMSMYPVTYGVALHWVMGIAFMLFVTVIILELKDVLHPEVLNGVVRIPNPDQNLLETLLEDSWGTHARRSIVSSVIYILLIICYLIVPVTLLKSIPLGVVQAILPLRPPTSYVWVNGQLLSEICVAYLIVYYTIDPFKQMLRNVLDKVLPKVFKFLGLEAFLMPLPAPTKEETPRFLGTFNGALYTDADFHGPRKILQRKTPSWCALRVGVLGLIVWVAVVCLNVAILTVFASAMYLPFWAFRIKETYQHGPYGVLATGMLMYLLWNRRDKLHQAWELGRYLGAARPFVLAASAVVPYLVTSVVNCTLSEKSLKGVEFVDMAKDTLGGIWTLGLLFVVFDMISNKLIPTWVAFHTILRDKKYLKGRRLMNRE